jgi:hypothetical protein
MRDPEEDVIGRGWSHGTVYRRGLEFGVPSGNPAPMELALWRAKPGDESLGYFRVSQLLVTVGALTEGAERGILRPCSSKPKWWVRDGAGQTRCRAIGGRWR